MEEELPFKICTSFGVLNEKALWEALELWSKGESSFDEKGLSKEDLLINLVSYKVGGNRNTASKGMLQHYEEKPKCCITLDPNNSMIW